MSQVDELKTGVAGDGPLNADVGKVVFQPEQQTRVQELIDDAYKKAYGKAMRSKGAGEEVERLKVEVERLKDERKSAAILRALSRHNVVDAEEVTELLRNRVRMEEDGGLSIAGSTGGVQVNGFGAPMTLEEFVGEWLSERPHHLRASGAGGSGSHGALFGNGSFVRQNLNDPASWRNMPRKDLDRLLDEGINVTGTAGQVYSFKDVKNPFIEARKRRFSN
ncbi:MAG: hypothetical protein HY884_09740 [Deltaproteobacteria bacterium]|nr:hypothetical protein [Deltaproteobacteria bacterium]